MTFIKCSTSALFATSILQNKGFSCVVIREIISVEFGVLHDLQIPHHKAIEDNFASYSVSREVNGSCVAETEWSVIQGAFNWLP